MHACLSVDEIVRLIAHELVASGGTGTAVALACCCKNFEDPVLDALWVEQDRLFPLLDSFPADVWNEGGCTSFKRLPTTIEWDRFRKYAQRMRKLEEFGALDVLPSEVLIVLQPRTTNDPFLPNLNTLSLSMIEGPFVPFISLFLSPRVTSISFEFSALDPCIESIVSTVTALPTHCPNLQAITLYFLPRDPIITAAISDMLLATGRNTLRKFRVDFPLKEEADEVVCKLPNLCDLSVVIERKTSLPSASLPNLTELEIVCGDVSGWPGLFHGATFGKLKSVTFHPTFEGIDNFLGTFERVALSSSIQDTLSKFHIFAFSSWNPNYSSLLPFTQLVDLVIDFTCSDGCTSTVDDDIVISLSRAMPKLQVLKLGDEPCGELGRGVTAKGLMALALHCPNLRHLRIHFQVASLSAPPASPGITRNAEPTGSWTDCGLIELEVWWIVVPEESVLTVALTLLQIFPQIAIIDYMDAGWKKVENAIHLSKRIVDYSKAALELGS